MRLTFVISSLTCGGAEKIMSVMANHWAEKGWDVTLLTFDNGSIPPFFSLRPNIFHKHLNIAVHSSNAFDRLRNSLMRIRILRKNILKNSPDVVISFIHTTNILTLIALAGTGIPVIVSERNDPFLQNIGRLGEISRKWTYPFADCVVVQTEHIRDYFAKKIHFRIRIISNPVSLPKNYDSLIETLSLRNPSIIAIGKFHRQKGFDILLDAFSQIKDEHPKWSLTILGDGKLRPELERQRDSLGLSDRVYLPGFVNNPLQYLQQADIFVMPSRYEGFPNALCEAMACGLPVIVSDFRSAVDILVEDGISGIIVPRENIMSLAVAMKNLIANKDRRIQLGLKAKRISERFELHNIMSQWEECLESILT